MIHRSMWVVLIKFPYWDVDSYFSKCRCDQPFQPHPHCWQKKACCLPYCICCLSILPNQLFQPLYLSPHCWEETQLLVAMLHMLSFHLAKPTISAHLPLPPLLRKNIDMWTNMCAQFLEIRSFKGFQFSKIKSNRRNLERKPSQSKSSPVPSMNINNGSFCIDGQK